MSLPVSQAMVTHSCWKEHKIPTERMMFQNNPFWALTERDDNISKKVIDSGQRVFNMISHLLLVPKPVSLENTLTYTVSTYTFLQTDTLEAASLLTKSFLTSTQSPRIHIMVCPFWNSLQMSRLTSMKKNFEWNLLTAGIVALEEMYDSKGFV